MLWGWGRVVRHELGIASAPGGSQPSEGISLAKNTIRNQSGNIRRRHQHWIDSGRSENSRDCPTVQIKTLCSKWPNMEQEPESVMPVPEIKLPCGAGSGAQGLHCTSKCQNPGRWVGDQGRHESGKKKLGTEAGISRPSFSQQILCAEC